MSSGQYWYTNTAPLSINSLHKNIDELNLFYPFCTTLVKICVFLNCAKIYYKISPFALSLHLKQQFDRSNFTLGGRAIRISSLGLLPEIRFWFLPIKLKRLKFDKVILPDFNSYDL